MGKNDVHMVMTAAEAPMVQAWLNARRSVGQFASEVDKAGQRGRKAGEDIQKAFSKAIKEIRRGFLSLFGLSGLQSTVRTFFNLIRSEFQAVRAEGQKSFGVQRDLGRQLRQIEFLQPKGTDISTDEIAELIRTQSRGIPLPEMARLVQTAITAGVGPDTRSRVNVPIQLADFLSAFDTQTTESIVQKIVAAQEVLPGASARGQAALFTSALSASPAGTAGETKLFADNIFSAATQLVAAGFTQKEALTNLIALQQRSQDIEGSTSRTNLITLVEDLETRLKQAGVRDVRGQEALDFIRSSDPVAQKISRDLLGALRQGVGRFEAKADLTEDPEERAELRARARGRRALVELIQPTFGGRRTETQEFARKNQQVILEGQRGVELFNQKVVQSSSMMATSADTVDRSFNQLANQIRGQSSRAVRERVRQFMEEQSVLAGDTAFAGKARAVFEQLQGVEGLSEQELTIRAIRQSRDLAISQAEKRTREILQVRSDERPASLGDLFIRAEATGERLKAQQAELQKDAVLIATKEMIERLNQTIMALEDNTNAVNRNASASEAVATVPGLGEIGSFPGQNQ